MDSAGFFFNSSQIIFGVCDRSWEEKRGEKGRERGKKIAAWLFMVSLLLQKMKRQKLVPRCVSNWTLGNI